MNHQTARRTAAALSALAISAGTTMLAAPAEAADYTCTGWQHEEFATSGYNTDVDIRLCVKKYTVAHAGYADIRWTDGGDYVKKFDNFDLKIRLERYDVDYDSATCDYTGTINLHETYSDTCNDVYANVDKSGGWSVDGYVAYDYDADGEGGKTWSLGGTPLIN